MLKIELHKHYIFFIISSIIFLMVENSMYTLSFLYTYGVVFGIVSAVLFTIYTSVYLLGLKSKKKNGSVLDIVFLLSLLNFIAMFLLTGPVSNYIVYYNVNSAFAIGLNTVLIIVVAFPLFLGAYLIREKGLVRIGSIVLAIVIILLVVYFLSGIFIKYYSIDDEVFISIREIPYFLMGMNPYHNSVAQQVYYNSTVVGFTQTTSNQVIGVLNYPALYMFSFIPFYFIFPPSIYNIEHLIVPFRKLYSLWFYCLLQRFR